MTKPLRVAVTGAAGNISYSLLFRLAAGDCYGPNQPIILQMLEIPPAMKALEGVVMELQDCAFPLLAGIETSDDPKAAFRGANQIFLVGSRPRTKGMERNDLIAVNGPIFVGQGKAIQSDAADDVFVVTVGNPCNTNAFIAMKNAPEVPRERFTAMTRLDQNRAVAQLAVKTGQPVTAIENVIIYGNHSSTMFPDYANGTIGGRGVLEVVKEEAWLKGEFLKKIQQRGAAIIEARGASSAASAAAAAIDHMRDAWFGTGARAVSMAIPSNGDYGIPKDTMFSVPVRCLGRGKYEVVPGAQHDEFAKSKIADTLKELQEEAAVVKELC